MNTIKDVLNFCNAAIFYDYRNIGIIDELNQRRKCIFNNFHETIPVERILIFLSYIDIIIAKNNDNEIENVIEIFDDSRSSVLYMLSIEKLIGDEDAN